MGPPVVWTLNWSRARGIDPLFAAELQQSVPFPLKCPGREGRGDYQGFERGGAAEFGEYGHCRSESSSVEAVMKLGNSNVAVPCRNTLIISLLKLDGTGGFIKNTNLKSWLLSLSLTGT